MGTDTKMRPAGMLVGRCMVGMTDSPRNRWGGAEDALAQPDGAKFVSYGENHLSAAPNRGLFALANNIDTLNHIANRGEADPFVITLASVPVSTTLDLGLELPYEPVAIGQVATDPNDLFYLVDSTSGLPVYASDGTRVYVTEVQNSDGSDPWTTRTIGVSKTVKEMEKYGVKISGHVDNGVRAGQIALISGIPGYTGFYLITNIETGSTDDYIWLGAALDSHDETTLAFGTFAERVDAYDDFQEASALTTQWTKSSLPGGAAVQVYFDGMFKPDCKLILNKVPDASHASIDLYFWYPTERGMSFNHPEIENQKLNPVVDALTDISLQDAYEGKAKFYPAIFDAGEGREIEVDGGPVLLDTGASFAGVNNPLKALLQCDNSASEKKVDQLTIDDAPSTVTFNSVVYRRVESSLDFVVAEVGGQSYARTPADAALMDFIVCRDSAFDGTNWLTRQANGPKPLGDLIKFSDSVWGVATSWRAAPSSDILIKSLYGDALTGIAAAYVNCSVYRAVAALGVGSHNGNLSLQEPGDTIWDGKTDGATLGVFSCVDNAVTNVAKYTRTPAVAVVTGVYDHPAYPAVNLNLGMSVRPYDFRVQQSTEYPSTGNNALILLSNSETFGSHAESLLHGANIVLASDKVTVAADTEVEVEAPTVDINGTTLTTVDSPTVDINGTGGSGAVDIDAVATVTVDAPSVDITGTGGSGSVNCNGVTVTLDASGGVVIDSDGYINADFAYSSAVSGFGPLTNAHDRLMLGSKAATIDATVDYGTIAASDTCTLHSGVSQAFIAAADTCTVDCTGTYSANMAALASRDCSLGSRDTSSQCVALASAGYQVDGEDCAVLASSAAINAVVDGSQSASIASVDYPVDGLGCVAIASHSELTASIEGNYSVALASNRCSTDSDHYAQCAISSFDSVLHGDYLASIAALGGSTITGVGSSLVSAYDCDVDGDYSSAVISKASLVEGDSLLAIASSYCALRNPGLPVVGHSVLLASKYAELAEDYTIAGGADAGTLTPNYSNQNLTWKINSATGNITALTITPGDPSPDYAEYFENVSPGVLPVGSLLTRVGSKVRAACSGERIIGVVSAHPSVVCGGADLSWAGKYARDEFGAKIAEIGTDGVRRFKYSDAYDASKSSEYTPRTQRPEEWTCVGLLGQVHVRIDATVTSGTLFIAPGTAGVGTHSEAETRCELMEITTPFSEEKGYGVALCLIR
jgi:hypothetical protein